MIEGWVFDHADLDRRYVVELLLDGLPTRTARADLYEPELFASGYGDGCHGFNFVIDPEVLPALRRIDVRIANLDRPVGETLLIEAADPAATSGFASGAVGWEGDLRLTGWVQSEKHPFPPRIEAWVDDALVAVARADLWRSIRRGDETRACPGFDLVLPRRLADGRAKSVTVLVEGLEIPGSPLQLVAFDDGLEAFLAERAEVVAEQPRGRVWDRLFPGVVPFDAFDAWRRRFASPGTAEPLEPIAMVVVGEKGADRTLDALGLAEDTDWVIGVLPDTGAPTTFSPADLLAFVEEAAPDCPVLVFTIAGAQVDADGVRRLAAALAAAPLPLAYGDVALTRPGAPPLPLGFPAFDHERFLEQGYGALWFAMRRETVLAAAEAGCADLFRLFFSAVDGARAGQTEALHVPGVGPVLPAIDPSALAPILAEATRDHLAGRGVAAEVEPRPSASLPMVSVRRGCKTAEIGLIILHDGTNDHLRETVAALEETRSRRTFTVTVASAVRGPAEAELAEEMRRDGHLWLNGDRLASAPRLLDLAVRSVPADLLCFYDASLRPGTTDWIDEMRSRIDDPSIGAVAPVLVDEAGVVVHAGWILGPDGRPHEAFDERHGDDPGYGDLLRVAHRRSAVSRRCMLTRRADFTAVGGFDPWRFPRHLADVDYCLRLGARGRRVVVAPQARLTLTGPSPTPRSNDPTLDREARLLRMRWPLVTANDPFHSPLLARGDHPHGGLAWPPGDLAPRLPITPRPIDVIPGI